VLFWFLLAHVVLGVLVLASPAAAKLHFWTTMIFGGWIATSTKRPSDIAIVAAYDVGP
jgi:hypothetical protein